MSIPNTITRTLDLAHPQEKVWAALTTVEGITAWFGSHAEGKMTPGHAVRMRGEQGTTGRLPRSRWSSRCRCSPSVGDLRGPGGRPAADLRRVHARVNCLR